MQKPKTGVTVLCSYNQKRRYNLSNYFVSHLVIKNTFVCCEIWIRRFKHIKTILRDYLVNDLYYQSNIYNISMTVKRFFNWMLSILNC